MSEFNTIEFLKQGIAGMVILNRPGIHNAFNAEMISEMRIAIERHQLDKSVRVIVIKAKGKSFSSGADLNYMRQQAAMTKEQNIEDARKLARLFYEIYSSEKPIITVSHGNIAGGANGIIAASDIAITSLDSVFRFSEVLLGLVPATISPYIIDRIGRSKAMELLLSGRTFTGEEAQKNGLVNKAVSTEQLDNELDKLLTSFRQTAPAAVLKTKKLLLNINSNLDFEKMIDITSGIIAEARASDEGTEGMDAFFGKRKANWVDESI